FFSSRRRHTRCLSDWSSDVCSSDLAAGDADLKCLAVRQRITRHVSAVAPAPQADARAIDVRLALQPREAVFQIAQLQLAEIFVRSEERRVGKAGRCWWVWAM